jgi:hypothetical protein
MSAIRVVKNTPFTLLPDVFCNIDKLHKIRAPLLIIHGTEDEVINIFHGRKLFTLAQNASEPLWLEGGQHNDLEQRFFPTMVERITRFINEKEHRKLTKKEITQMSGLAPLWTSSFSSFS